MPTPITTWQMLDDIEVTRNLITKFGRRSASAFGNSYTYEPTRPTKTVTFSGELVYRDEVFNIVAACEEPVSETASTITIRVHGINWTGKPTNCKFKQVLAAGYYNGYVVMDRPTPES